MSKVAFDKFELQVAGTLWSGSEAGHLYSLANKPHPQTLAEAKAIAGDFESITKARIIKTHTTVEVSIVKRLTALTAKPKAKKA